MKQVSYAIITVNSHGYLIRSGHEHVVNHTEVNDYIEVGAAVPFLVPKEHVNLLIRDPRDHDGTGYVMVYEHGKTEDEIMAILKPQMVELLSRLRNIYETLQRNVEQMIAAVDLDGSLDYICKGLQNGN